MIMNAQTIRSFSGLKPGVRRYLIQRRKKLEAVIQSRWSEWRATDKAARRAAERLGRLERRRLIRQTWIEHPDRHEWLVNFGADVCRELVTDGLATFEMPLHYNSVRLAMLVMTEEALSDAP
jgi:hypothetical protein